jgi:hypothetical protein
VTLGAKTGGSGPVSVGGEGAHVGAAAGSASAGVSKRTVRSLVTLLSGLFSLQAGVSRAGDPNGTVGRTFSAASMSLVQSLSAWSASFAPSN